MLPDSLHCSLSENPPEEIVKFLMPAIDTFEKFALFIMAHHGETGGEQKMDVDAS